MISQIGIQISYSERYFLILVLADRKILDSELKDGSSESSVIYLFQHGSSLAGYPGPPRYSGGRRSGVWKDEDAGD